MFRPFGLRVVVLTIINNNNNNNNNNNILNIKVNYTNTPKFIVKLHLAHLSFKKNTLPQK
jgi:hypothetical protein